MTAECMNAYDACIFIWSYAQKTLVDQQAMLPWNKMEKKWRSWKKK